MFCFLQAAYVKASFLTSVVNGEVTSPIVDKEYALRLLGTMQGGYNVGTLVSALDSPDAKLAEIAPAPRRRTSKKESSGKQAFRERERERERERDGSLVWVSLSLSPRT